MPQELKKPREGGQVGREQEALQREGVREVKIEASAVKPEEPAESEVVWEPSSQVATSIPPPSPQTTKSSEVKAVEDILEQDLSEVYFALPEDKRAAFKAKGEEVTSKIVAVLGEARKRAKNILIWIRDWLRMIPGVNKFFLEQESKIKTDRIVSFSEQKKTQN